MFLSRHFRFIMCHLKKKIHNELFVVFCFLFILLENIGGIIGIIGSVSYVIRIIKSAEIDIKLRVFAHGVIGRQIDPSWGRGGGPIEPFLFPASAPQLV